MPKPKVGPPVSPQLLDKIPKVVIRALDPSEVLQRALSTTNHPTIYGPVIALGTLESYLDAAKRQQQRIERARSTMRMSKKTRSSLFDDVHFYLICWTRIAKLARFIRDSTKFERIKLVLRCYRVALDERIGGRDHLEHFEERLPGGSRRHELRLPQDLLNMSGDFLTYGGRKLDIGPASVRLLTRIVGEFRTALLFDSVEVLAAANVNQLSLLVQRAASHVHIAQIAKKLNKRLGEN
jgi:hypothetical protein